MYSFLVCRVKVCKHFGCMDMHKNMETNTCNVNHLDADAHLPPRKRLLAGLKRQNSDVNSPVPSTPSSAGNDALLNNSLNSRLSYPSLPNKEIVEVSRIAAMKAAKVAEVARAIAEDKAAKAAKAVSAAKSALDLVAILSDEAASKEKLLKKNKLKKHVTVEALYNNKGKTSYRADEELARKLHQSINSSPRILKNTSGSDVKNHKHKRLKSSTLSGRTSMSSGVPVGEGNQPSTASGSGNGGEVDTEGPIKKIDMIMVDLNSSNSDNVDQLKLDKGGGTEWSRLSKSGNSDVLDNSGKKRGRVKQKKLPLSICSFRDQNSPKGELKSQGMHLLEDDSDRNAVDNQPLFSKVPSGNSLMPIEKIPTWKCQSFKAPVCVKQNKVMQS